MLHKLFKPIQPAISDEELTALRQRNRQRAQALVEAMGDTHVCHPDNRVQPLPEDHPLRGRQA